MLLLYTPPGQDKDIPEELDDESKSLGELGVPLQVPSELHAVRLVAVRAACDGNPREARHGPTRKLAEQNIVSTRTRHAALPGWDDRSWPSAVAAAARELLVRDYIAYL